MPEQNEDKTFLVTGATSGIGRVTAEKIAASGAKVILVARDREKANAAAAEISQRTGNSAISTYIADLSSQRDVRAVAAEISGVHPKIDVLVNNAGSMFTRRKESVDGIEMTWALNHLGYFLLTNLLLPNIKAADKARIINVSSKVHVQGTIDFDDLALSEGYSWMKAYARSKLANVLFTFELANRLLDDGISVNCLHPGVVGTNFGSGNGIFYRTGFAIARPFILSPEKGAETSIYLATSEDVDGITGKYFEKCAPTPGASAANDKELQQRLWQVSEEMVGGIS